MSVDTLERTTTEIENSIEKTKVYTSIYEPELLQKEIDCCTAATD